jgi:hypothetical protein
VVVVRSRQGTSAAPLVDAALCVLFKVSEAYGSLWEPPPKVLCVAEEF